MKPRADAKPVRRHIIRGYFQIVALLVILGASCVVSLPKIVQLVPDHPQAFQGGLPLRGQIIPPLPAGLHLPQVADPPAQKQSLRRNVVRRNVQAALFVPVSAQGFIVPLPGIVVAVFPPHPYAVQLGDPLLGENSGSLSCPDQPLGVQPMAQAVALRRFVALGHVQLPVLMTVRLSAGKHQLPGSGKSVLHLVEQPSAFPNLVDDGEVVGFYPAVPVHGAVIGRRLLHLLPDCADAVQVFDVVHHVDDHRLPGCPRRQGPANLLFVYDGRHGWTKQDDSRDILHVNAFV